MSGADDVVKLALKLVMGAGEKAAPKAKLPMDLDNRMYRASEMGFDPTRRYYHLTRKDFDAFKLGADPSSHTGGGAIWLRDDPRNNISAHQVPSFEAEGARDIPLFIRPTKELPTMEWSLLRQQGKLNDQFPLMVTPEENKMLRDMGYSHASIGGETVVFDPKDLRSPHAVFDPDEIESADYMKASGGRIAKGPGGWLDDVVKMAGKVISGEGDDAAKAGIKAYHGSPHDFDRFDMSKIGTGEGAQAYGHGLYFADTEGTAKYYRDQLSKQAFDVKKIADPYLALSDEDAVRKIGYAIKQAEVNGQKGIAADYKAAQDWFKAGRPDQFSAGRMYEVEINADPDSFLDWDKPLSEQPEAVRKAYAKAAAGDDPLLSELLDGSPESLQLTGLFRRSSGAQAYNTFVDGNKEAATQRLREAGIPGIKYLDAGSRGAGDGTRNYVVFDDKLISIVRKYGIAGASAMLGYNLMEQLDPKQALAATVADKHYQSTQPEVKGGMLPPGMEPSGEMTSRIPSASDRISDYVRSILGGDEATKGQRTETVMNVLDQTPLSVGPMAYDVTRGVAEKFAYADGGAVDDDITDALRIAKDVGGGTTPVMMEDAKGNKYDAQGNVIPPTNPGPNPARSDATPQSVAAKAVNDPATYDALMERYAVPDRDIAEYEALKETVSKQPQDIRQMTHVGDRPRRDVTVDMPLFGGEYSMGQAPYDVASGISGAAQTAYDLKTVPFYFNPFTAPFAMAADTAEGIATGDPLSASLAIGFGPGGKFAKAAGIGATNYFMAPDDAEAGPERWFSKAMEVARALPMEKMTGQQALAMLRKGVSPEELRWTGADVFLSTTPKISKDELLDYLKNNRFQTEDVTLGGSKPSRYDEVTPSKAVQARYKDQWDALAGEKRRLDEEYWNAATAEERRNIQTKIETQAFDIEQKMDQIHSKMVKETIEEMGGLGLPVQYGPGSRFGDQYVTRGGEGYGEDLYKMPNAMKLYNSYIKQLREKYNEGALGDMPLTVSERGTLDNLMEAAGDERKVYTSSHFPQYPGYLAHSRSQTLNVEPPGANRPYKAWNVEEAQSDLAKSGRKSGFYDPVVYQKWVNEYYANEKTIEQARDNLKEVADRVSNALGPEPKFDVGNFYNDKMNSDFNKWHESRQDALNNDPSIVEARKKLNDAIVRGRELEAAMPNTQAAPIGPFVKSMEGWSKLTVKKQLDKALDSGVEYFTWTPGEAQAQRYSLSRVADNIVYNAPFVAPSGKSYPGRLVATKNGSQVFEKKGVKPEQLSEFIGEELADKIKANKTTVEEGPMKGWEKSSISGDELKFGGEGMRKYYDNAFVKYVQDVFKEATGEKPNIEIITAQTADGPRQQLGIRLTDEMREKSRFSDFNKGGRVADPVVNKALALTSEY